MKTALDYKLMFKPNSIQCGPLNIYSQTSDARTSKSMWKKDKKILLKLIYIFLSIRAWKAVVYRVVDVTGSSPHIIIILQKLLQ